MTIDLDALEKLADEAPGKKWALEAGFLEIDGMSPLFELFGSPCDCGEGGNPICGNDGEAEAAAAFMIAAQPATIKALIAELRAVQAFAADEIAFAFCAGFNDAIDREKWDDCYDFAASKAGDYRNDRIRAFLARNGEGEG